ncbi:serine/threonine protein kinase [Yoonia sp. F2084L]|uniref:serine/threonine protein kinase n=1 Tax=Yoonia sp. F2084L TaxID=2926419 RepID=UPI001FF53E68|nr:serine/threonine-protein kinase [Yoonia sp. F2084L]MCK0097257.1 serine/threonine protein kinase [Yoonia sp. F2084L]
MTAATGAEIEQDINQGSEALPHGTALLEDQFTIDRPLGNGGFGITYLARDNYLDRNVVIKECYPEVFCLRQSRKVLVRSTQHHEKYRTIVEMFMREARSIAKMRHPNIVGVHRIFEDNETAYMVLDLIQGRDLLGIINDEREKLAPDQVKEILIKLLDAVDLVHKRDLLHRDISPDNILLDKWGSPVLIDFGAAREEASRETRAISSVLVVKDGYSPQEFYFAGGKQGPSSDLYALGATFYHLISGVAPPNSQTRMAEFAANNPDPCEPLAGRFPEYDNDILESIDKAMQVLPKARLQSAQEWMSLIKAEERRMKPVRVIKNDDLGKTLTRLVSETNEYVMNSEPRESLKTPVRPTEKSEDKVQSAPAWVEEFNRETTDAPPRTKRAALQHEGVTEKVTTRPGMLAEPAKKRKRGLLKFFSRR